LITGDPFIAVVILSVTTGLSFYTSFIMPDLFSAINILCLGILLTSKTLRFNGWMILVLILYLFSNICHLSNLAISTIVIGLLVIASLIWRSGEFFAVVRAKKWLLLTIAIIPWVLLPTINYSTDGRFRLSDSGNVFIMGRLAESDILKTYLDENCQTLNFSLCGKQDELPKYAYEFLWHEDSPFRCTDNTEIHWEECWRNRNKEYGPVIDDILTTPGHLGQFLLLAISETGRQLIIFRNGHLMPMMEGSPVIKSIKHDFADDYETYTSSTQSKKGYSSTMINAIQPFTIVISCLLVLIMVSSKKLRQQVDNRLWLLLLIVVMGLLANAFVSATFSNVVDRYQGRVIWLLPFIVILILFSVSKQKPPSQPAGGFLKPKTVLMAKNT